MALLHTMCLNAPNKSEKLGNKKSESKDKRKKNCHINTAVAIPFTLVHNHLIARLFFATALATDIYVYIYICKSCVCPVLNVCAPHFFVHFCRKTEKYKI